MLPDGSRLMLAQANGAAGIFVWSLLLLVGVIGLFLAIFWLKRWIRSDESPADEGGFTLASLRELHRRGEITDEEYERTKAQIVSAARSSVTPPSAEIENPPERKLGQ